MTPADRPSVLLLGCTDLTAAVARRLLEERLPLAGVVAPPREFPISYSTAPVHNSRYADMAGWCRDAGVPFWQYGAADDLVQAAAVSGASAALAVGWYHVVPVRVRQLFPRGCVGIHASLLPRYRGGAPLNWALLNGDEEAGVSLFELSAGVDHGLLYEQRRFAIGPTDYIGDLLRRAELVTLDLVAAAIPKLLEGTLVGRAQEGPISYGLQRQPSDGAIDWRLPARDIARLVRGVSRPYPGARTWLGTLPLVIWRASAAERAPVVHGAAGQIASLNELPHPAVVTGDGLLLVEEIEGPDGFDVATLAGRHQHRLQAFPVS